MKLLLDIILLPWRMRQWKKSQPKSDVLELGTNIVKYTGDPPRYLWNTSDIQKLLDTACMAEGVGFLASYPPIRVPSVAYDDLIESRETDRRMYITPRSGKICYFYRQHRLPIEIDDTLSDDIISVQGCRQVYYRNRDDTLPTGPR